MLALAIALTLVPPVPGGPTRAFDYAGGDPFARGQHRGVDLAAPPGRPVRAACGGRVSFAGRAGANGRAVTVRCGAWSVTHLPLSEPAVHAGDHIAAGTIVGRAAPSRAHPGMHLGVRRASEPFGYVDPTPLLRAPPRHAPPAAPRTIARRPDQRAPHPAPLPSRPVPDPTGRRTAPAPGTRSVIPAPAVRAAPAATPGSSPIAPWPAWAGLALLLVGACGTGAARARRARRARRACRAAPARAAATPVR